MPPVIRIENLSKSYRIRHSAERGSYRTLRDALAAAAAWPLRKLQGKANGRVEEFWALKDVDLNVEQGEVVGIIGRNGAGKSTLLKILSRITAPTTGRAELRGRVGSLLEVGTGFHPELTGRENVFLNGSIIGMGRREIQRRFDEIVAFADVERFLDTPVKRYSSGMYVRLAFAVAAHLEPEILIIDEVLAVGDAGFQKKCLGKMGDVAKSGRTVLFVSHNLAAVNALCASSILIKDGRVAAMGATEQVVQAYMRNFGGDASPNLKDRARARKHTANFVELVVTTTRGGSHASQVFIGDRVLLQIAIESICDASVWVGVTFWDSLGRKVMHSSNRLHGLLPLKVRERTVVVMEIPRFDLAAGIYTIGLSMYFASSLEIADEVDQAGSLEVLGKDLYGSGFQVASQYGAVHLPHTWQDGSYRPLREQMSTRIEERLSTMESGQL